MPAPFRTRRIGARDPAERALPSEARPRAAVSKSSCVTMAPASPAHAFERIFERFCTDRPNQGFGQNSGLGLSISRQIVEAHRRRIRAMDRTDPGRRTKPLGAASSSGCRPQGDRRAGSIDADHPCDRAHRRRAGDPYPRTAFRARAKPARRAIGGSGARKRWFGQLVADDRVQIEAQGGRLVLSPHPSIAGLVGRGTGGFFGSDTGGRGPCAWWSTSSTRDSRRPAAAAPDKTLPVLLERPYATTCRHDRGRQRQRRSCDLVARNSKMSS